MFGGVGTGKTMLMDLFVQACPPDFQVIMALSFSHRPALSFAKEVYCSSGFRKCVSLTAVTVMLWTALESWWMCT